MLNYISSMISMRCRSEPDLSAGEHSALGDGGSAVVRGSTSDPAGCGGTAFPSGSKSGRSELRTQQSKSVQDKPLSNIAYLALGGSLARWPGLGGSPALAREPAGRRQAVRMVPEGGRPAPRRDAEGDSTARLRSPSRSQRGAGSPAKHAGHLSRRSIGKPNVGRDR